MSFDPRFPLVLGFLMVMSPWAQLQARAQATKPAAKPAENQVVLKAGATLKINDKVVDTGMSHRFYTVERSQGAWRWLVSGDVSGWAKASDIVPLNQAIEFYSEEIKRNPHAAWAYCKRGMIYHDMGKIDDAFSDYSDAIRQDLRFVPALINRGNIWLVTRKTPDRAITDFTDALEADPKSILAHVNRGIAYQTKGDYDKALADYDQAIKLGLRTAAAYNNRGHARDMKNDHDGAIADYNEAIKLDPDYALAWMNRGRARQSKGDYKEALADFVEATRLNPKSPQGYADRAWLLATCPDAKFRDGKEAIKLATTASELAGKSSSYYFDISAAAHAEAGDFTKAIAHERQAISLIPKKADLEERQHADEYRARLKLYEDKKPYREKL
jgi:tetratricopeptide (TPR) repeat protein